MRKHAKYPLAGFALAASCLLAPCWAAERPPSLTAKVQPLGESASCMQRLWGRLLPLIATNSGYIDTDDIERVADVKLGEPIAIGAHDSISDYEATGPYSLAPSVPGSRVLTGRATLSVRLERHRESKPDRPSLTWQRMQGRVGGTDSSVLDLSCSDGGTELSLQRAEVDLESLGFKRVGALARPIHVEVYSRDWLERVDLYYEIPVETTPDVTSIHIVGVKHGRAALAAPRQ